MRSLDILAIDDMAPSRLLLQRQFEADGHRAVIAQDPERALDHLASRAFDVLLLDLHMPRTDGFQLLEEARARHPADRPFPEVIVLTSDETPEAAAMAKAKGVRYFVQKRQQQQALPAVLAEIARAAR
jgi:CheY-like chemotaxis protein